MREISGGVGADPAIIARNPGTAAVVDSSEDGPTPPSGVERSSSRSSCGRFGRSLSRFSPVALEAEESTTRKEPMLENLSSSVRGTFSSPLSRSRSTELVVSRLAPGQGMREANPLNIGNGVVRCKQGENMDWKLNDGKRRRWKWIREVVKGTEQVDGRDGEG